MGARRRLIRAGLAFLPALLIVLFLGLGGVAATGAGAAQVEVEIGDNFFNPATITRPRRRGPAAAAWPAGAPRRCRG
ncbi:MAG: hypothetical protein M3Q65_05725 [Chloroflexota bacterium]|nr:hypothetical protein [Chloroflexota bacterium]